MRTKNIIIGAMCLAFAFAALGTAQAETTTQTTRTNVELLKTIEGLRAEIRILKAQIAGGPIASSTPAMKRFRLNQEFGIGASNDEIKQLQKILATDPSIYPEGMVTGYFGPLTSRAVARLQTKHKLENRGMLTSETRDFINSILEAYGIEDALIPADILTSGPSRVRIETEMKDGVLKYKFKIKSKDDESEVEIEDEDESNDDSDDNDNEDEDESNDEDEDGDDDSEDDSDED